MQKPVTLYSFLQKFWVVVLYVVEYIVFDIARNHILDFVGAELRVDDAPYNVVALHPYSLGQSQGRK